MDFIMMSIIVYQLLVYYLYSHCDVYVLYQVLGVYILYSLINISFAKTCCNILINSNNVIIGILNEF